MMTMMTIPKFVLGQDGHGQGSSIMVNYRKATTMPRCDMFFGRGISWKKRVIK